MSTRTKQAVGARIAAERLGAALARLTRSLRRAERLPLGASTVAVLATLHDQGPTRLGDLAKQEGVTPATLSRIVAVLEEEGCAERVVDEVDRRSAFLAITPAGRAVVADIRRERARALSARAESLDPSQRAALAAALDALEALAAG